MINSPLSKLGAVFPPYLFRSGPPRQPDTDHIKTDSDLKSKTDLPTASGDGDEPAPAKQEQVIQEKLARFARLPVSSVFEFVVLSSPIPMACPD
jgi:hypothetical protein